MDQVRGMLLNFDDYKDFFKQQIIESKINKHEGDKYDAFLRFYKKQVSAVVLNVNETAKYTLIDPMRGADRLPLHAHRRGGASQEQKEARSGAPGGRRRRISVAIERLFANGTSRQRRLRRNRNDYVGARRRADILDTSRYLNGFQSFPNELTQGYIDRVGSISIRDADSRAETPLAGVAISALAVSLISCPGSPPA